MQTINVERCQIDRELERVVEPLADYLCASEHPRTALVSALNYLLSEVAQTCHTATEHVLTFSETRWS